MADGGRQRVEDPDITTYKIGSIPLPSALCRQPSTII
jgi:hypothetical protein